MAQTLTVNPDIGSLSPRLPLRTDPPIPTVGEITLEIDLVLPGVNHEALNANVKMTSMNNPEMIHGALRFDMRIPLALDD